MFDDLMLYIHSRHERHQRRKQGDNSPLPSSKLFSTTHNFSSTSSLASSSTSSPCSSRIAPTNLELARLSVHAEAQATLEQLESGIIQRAKDTAMMQERINAFAQTATTPEDKERLALAQSAFEREKKENERIDTLHRATIIGVQRRTARPLL